jgi:hypothetical protein
MARTVLPVDSDDFNYTVDVALSGSLYRFSLCWNTRGEFWSLDVLDQDDSPIVAGVKLVADWELLAQFPDTRLPPGLLYCVDLSGQSADPGATDLGSRVFLVYDDGQ